jgi:hypothetical protein
MTTRPFRLFALCVGSLGLLGSFLMTWIAPKVIAWYFEPPAQPGAFSCKAPIEWALSRYQLAQGYGLLGGAAAGLVLFFLLLQRSRAKAATSVSVRRPL